MFFSAIAQGTVPCAIQELEGKKKDIEIEIAKEQIAKPKYTREQYKEFFERSKVADLTDHNQRKALINYFVNAVVLYDDDAIFYLNYKENALKLLLVVTNSVSFATAFFKSYWLTRSVAPPLPKKSCDFSGTPKANLGEPVWGTVS